MGLGKVDTLENQKVVFEKDTMLNWKPVEFFFQIGCNMTHSVKFENDMAKSILNSL